MPRFLRLLPLIAVSALGARRHQRPAGAGVDQPGRDLPGRRRTCMSDPAGTLQTLQDPRRHPGARRLIVLEPRRAEPDLARGDRTSTRPIPASYPGRELGGLRPDHQDRERRRDQGRPRSSPARRRSGRPARASRGTAGLFGQVVEALGVAVRRVRPGGRHPLQRPLPRSAAGQLLDRLERAELRADIAPQGTNHGTDRD